MDLIIDILIAVTPIVLKALKKEELT